MAKTDVILVNLSGRGDKDMGILAREMNLKGSESAGQPVSKPAKGQVQNNAD
jgi:tryptophan synthase beta subunit